MATGLLLIDADVEAAKIVIGMLADPAGESYTIDQAPGLAEAKTLLQQRTFDAVLLDLFDPAEQIAGALAKLAAQTSNIPVIILSHADDERAGDAAVQGGAQDYLVKSKINGDVLRRVIRYSIDRVRFRREFAGLTQEVERRQMITDALRESQNRMLAITENLYEGVLVFDENGHIALSNRAAQRLLGDGLRSGGRNIDQVLHLKQGDALLDFAAGPLRMVIRDGRVVQDDDAVFVLADGSRIPVAYACSPLMEQDGVQGAILSFRDIGSYKQAQREALQSSKLASVGQLAAGIAHEINTPIQYIGDNLRFLTDAFQTLTGLLARAEILLREQEGPEAMAAKAAMAKARVEADADFLLANVPDATGQSLQGVAQVARIVLAMKEFSHPGDRAKAEIDLNRAVENTVAVSRNEWKQLAKLETRLDPDLPRVHCLGSEINQVLLNLIVNAVHAIEEAGRRQDGSIVLTTRALGGSVEISVEDNGIGMTEEVRQHIFDPFFTTKRIGKGTGQGLAICRDVVVAKHGGVIKVDSTPGQGSRFSVILPVLPAEDDVEELPG